MKTKTNTKIIFEKRERTTVWLRRGRTRTAWCELCAAQTEMLAPPDAARLSNTTQIMIFRRIESGELHFIETGARGLLICGKSLTGKFGQDTMRCL